MAPVRIAVIHGYEVVAAGLRAVLEQHPQRVEVVDDEDQAVDVVLYGARSGAGEHDQFLHDLMRELRVPVIVLGWPDTPEVDHALGCGARGPLSIDLSAEELIDGIEQIRQDPRAGQPAAADDCHPVIAQLGLTPRELDVLALIGAGLTNQQIGDRLFLSINSVKTYIRTAYGRLGVTRRAQAVVWVSEHGLRPPDPPPLEVSEAG